MFAFILIIHTTHLILDFYTLKYASILVSEGQIDKLKIFQKYIQGHLLNESAFDNSLKNLRQLNEFYDPSLHCNSKLLLHVTSEVTLYFVAFIYIIINLTLIKPILN